ncbi:hypothetical protein PVT71_14680 [Salipiger sp. H15]|uniref:Beta sliding clamp n=1 Tax=Alloyangia sp. H15 TaxID=3029062 RepID=A0AAU8APD2_9RHOB
MLHQAPKDMAAVKACATIPREPLKRASALMRKVIERRNTIPVLSYLKVEIAPGHVTLSGTDLDIELTVEIEAETEGAATFMVAERVFAGFAPGAAGPVVMQLMPGKVARDQECMDRISLSDGETSLTLNAHMPAEEFPHLKPNGGAKVQPTFTLSQTEVVRLFKLGRHCVSTELTRYYLNGTFLTTNPDTGTLRAVTTNGHKLARIDTEEPADFGALKGDDRKGLIVAAKAVDLLLNIAGKGGNEPVAFSCAEYFLCAEVAGTTLRAKTIDGTYPDYTRVIPSPSDNLVAHLSGAALSRMARAAKVIVPQLVNPVKLDFETGRIGFDNSHSDDGASFVMPLQCRLAEGCSSKSIGFNLAYLRQQGDITPTFKLSTAGEGEPALIHSDDPNALWVVMPMRL